MAFWVSKRCGAFGTGVARCAAHQLSPADGYVRASMAMPVGARCLLSARVLSQSLSTPQSCDSACDTLRTSPAVPHPNVHGVSSSCSNHAVCAWLQSHVSPLLDHSLRDRLMLSVSNLSVDQWRRTRGLTAEPMTILLVSSWSIPGGLLAGVHLGHPCSCPFCEAAVGDLLHCLSDWPTLSDLRELWLDLSLFGSQFSALAQHQVQSTRTVPSRGKFVNDSWRASQISGTLARIPQHAGLRCPALSACCCATVTEELPLLSAIACSRVLYGPLGSVSLSRPVCSVVVHWSVQGISN